MKKVIFIIGMFVNVCLVHGQIHTDQLARMQLYLDMHPELAQVNIHTDEAKGIAVFIYGTFEKYGIIPPVSYKHLNAQEQAEIQKFINTLQNLIHNPPTWEQIYAEFYRLHFGPPQPARYAGEDPALQYFNARLYGKVRAASGLKPQRIEIQSTSVPYNPPVDPQEKERSRGGISPRE